MADSLDDFFAKKDKKRGKDKQKAVQTSEALVRELEVGSNQNVYQVKRDKPSAAIELLGLDADDGSWRDFEDIEKRDYTGLKLKEMSIQDQNDDERRRLDQTEMTTESTPWRIRGEDKITDSKADAEPTHSEPSLPAQDKQKSLRTQETKPSESSLASSTSESKLAVSETDSSKDPCTSTDQKLGENLDDAASIKTDSKETKNEDTSAKKYLPPGARREEATKLEPSKLPKKTGGHYFKAVPDIQDTKAFPSLG